MQRDHGVGQNGGALIGVLSLMAPPLFWAGNFIVGRAMRGEIPPLTLSLWRWVIAFACLCPFAWQQMRRDLPVYWRYRGQVLRLAMAGVVAFNSLVYVGLQWTAAANGLLLNSFIPILIVLLGAIFFGQKLNGRQLIGLAISFLGVFTIILHGDWARLASLEFSRGDLVVLTAMVSWACYTLWLRAFPTDIDRVGLMGAQIVVALPVLFVLFGIETIMGHHAVWNGPAIAAVAYLGIFPSVLAYLLYTFGVARFGAVRAGMFIHLMPVFGVGLAALFLDETVELYHIIGIGAILSGIWFAGRRS